MEFTLQYDGLLPSATRSNRRVKEKHAIRCEFNYQLRQLWTQDPVLDRARQGLEVAQLRAGRVARPGLMADQPFTGMHWLLRLGGFNFVPLITRHNFLVCHLDVLLLRDGGVGDFIRHGGDLDNRLKILFDALRMPHSAEELGGATGNPDETFFVLLEDDSLITKLSIETQRRLRRTGESRDRVSLRIGVNVCALRVTIGSQGYVT
jgi:hypothetical protein